MVDSRAKGAEGEKQVKELLRKHTGLPFERVPMSGALPFFERGLVCSRHFNTLLYRSKIL